MNHSNHGRAALIALFFALTGCNAGGGTQPPPPDDEAAMTLGTVQRHVRIGMSNAEVAEVIGSPNIVSTDADRNEVWIYDRFATEVSYENTAAGLGLVIGGFGNDAGGFAGVGGQRSSGHRTRTQRTLTVIVKFDGDARVRDLSYHASRF